ncbi:hypothetical protein N0V93_006696 [Gnomoniopsis smithogilvyi]|uniref:Mso1 N-terminal domain-containing protein n=1 Tax=Gnomoniopsis smithogilvyi TaxID=1191159 RepID=A0A9W8YNP2_9PEZI|nr:hypothetical protein N0V93_006696 [Gnomoniopsis smithogilvyi]
MSWYSNIASRVNNSVSSLSRNLLNSEADGDTEDDTHVCRVLRQYYTEKGTGFPQWLPPDPKAPAPVVVQQPAAMNSRYGAGSLQTSQSAGGLSSLWDKNRGASASPGGPAAAPPGPRNPFAPRNAVSPDPAAAGGPMRPPMPGSAVRNGSYQGGSAPGSIQDRLKGRLGGGARTVSPGNTGSPFAPPPAAPARGGSGDYDPYRAGGGYGGDGGGRNNPYAPVGSDAGATGGGASSRYGGGGLPSGPRRMGGLPSGPRMR